MAVLKIDHFIDPSYYSTESAHGRLMWAIAGILVGLLIVNVVYAATHQTYAGRGILTFGGGFSQGTSLR